MKLLDQMRERAKPPNDPTIPDPTLDPEKIAGDRMRRAEIASQLIQDTCKMWRVELVTQVTFTGQQMETRVLVVAKE